MKPTVYIVHSGVDEDDRKLANHIQSGVAATIKTVVMTTDRLIKLWTVAGKPVAAGGVTIAILSHAMIDDASQRKALVDRVVPRRGFSFRHYFICRGVSPEEVRALPDLAPVFDNAALVTEQELPELIADVDAYVAHHEFPSLVRLLVPGVKLIFGTAIGLVLAQFARVYSLRFLLMASFGIILYMGARASWILPLTLLGFYIAGIGVARIDPLDLWPWLGRQWKLPTKANRVSVTGVFDVYGPLAFWGMAVGALFNRMGHYVPLLIGLTAGIFLQMVINLVARHYLRSRFQKSSELDEGSPLLLLNDTSDAICSPTRLEAGVKICLGLRKLVVNFTLSSSVILVLLSYFASHQLGTAHLLLYAATFFAGSMTPGLAARWWQLASAEVARTAGLTRDDLQYHTKVFRPIKAAKTPYSLGNEETSLEAFTDAEREQLIEWRSLIRVPHVGGFRRWRTPGDYAFISYAWRDDPNTHMLAKLSQTFKSIGVNHFLDRKDVENKFVIWREHVAPALQKCTHFFLVVSPGLKRGDVVLREIETTINRWYLELVPAVVCIAEPDTARLLREDPHVPLPLRFFLTLCPVMSFGEALNPQLLHYIIRHTRRQGMLQDWLTALSGASARQRIVRMRGIVEFNE